MNLTVRITRFTTKRIMDKANKATLVRLAFGFVFLLISLLFGCTVKHLSNSEQSSPMLVIAVAGDGNGYNTIPGEGRLNSITELLSSKDIFIVNAEGVFSEKLHFKDCHKFKKQSLFLGSTEALNFLPRRGISIASLANNHVVDCGLEGLVETMRELKKHGILTVGAGESIVEACKPLRLNIKGFKLAVLAYLDMSPAVLSYIDMDPDWLYANLNKGGVASWKLCNGQKQISEIRKEADIILVFVHMHHTIYSWTAKSNAATVSFVKKILDAGADIVIGSGAHCPQGIIGNDKGIALLSLGNFLLRPDYKIPEQGYRSILVNFTISKYNLKLAIVPLRIDIWGRPHVALQDDASDILNGIVSLSDQLGTKLEIQGERAYLEMKRTSNDIFGGRNVYMNK
jgi:hypothetical protein